MPRYIDAEKTAKALEKEVKGLASEVNHNYREGLQFALKMINDQSTVDVQEIKHGKWMGASDGDGIVCSVCGSDFCTLVLNVYNYNYCPNCGAKMDGEESDR